MSLKKITSIILGVITIFFYKNSCGMPFITNSATPTTALISKALDSNCITLLESSSSLPCNPAALTHTHSLSLSASLFFGHGYNAAQQINKIFRSNVNAESLKELIKKDGVLASEMTGSLTIKKKNIGLTILPYRLTYFSTVLNKAYPQITLYAHQEHSVQIQGGTSWNDRWEGGIQMRWVGRKVSYDQFALYDFIVKKDRFLKVHKQDVLYIEPGITYHFQNNWDPRLSLFIPNGGLTNKSIAIINTEPQPLIGFGISPFVQLGHWDVSFSLNPLDETTQKLLEKLQIGTRYSLGLADSVLNLSRRALSLGFLTQFWSARAGLYYSLVNQDNNNDPSFKYDTFYSEFGFDF